MIFIEKDSTLLSVLPTINLFRPLKLAMYYLDRYQEKLADLKKKLDIRQAEGSLPKLEEVSANPPNNLSIEIISLHIPKTAGSLFRGLLQKIYGEDRCWLEYTPVDGENLFQGLEKINSNHQIIHGHTAWRWISMFPNAKKIVWFRNPIARIVSEYCYVTSYSQEQWAQVPGGELNQQIIEQKLDIDKYIEFECFQNSMYAHCSTFPDIIDPILSYDFIGIQDFFSSDFMDLSDLLNFPKIELWKDNANQHEHYKDKLKTTLADKKLLSKIISLNHKDMEVYKLALESRAKRKGLSTFSLINSLDIPIST